MFVNFSEEVRHILKNAEKERDDLNHPYVGSEHLFLSILKNSKLKDILKKHKVTYDKFKEEIGGVDGTLIEKSEISKTYFWASKDGGYITAIFKNKDNKCFYFYGYGDVR